MVKKLKKKIKKIKDIKLFQTKVTTLFFGCLGVFVLLFIGYFLYFQITVPKNVDEILPSEKIILLAELSTPEFADFVEDNSVFKENFLRPFIQGYLNQDLAEFNEQARKWLGAKMAFAVYALDQNKDVKRYYLFLENNSQRNSLAFLHSLGLQEEELTKENYQNSDILSFSQSLNLSCSFLYGYLVCSNESQALKDLIDFNQGELGFLNNLTSYTKVKNNLPKTAGGKLYFDLQRINFNEYEIFLGPLKEYLLDGGITLTQINQGIRLNTYLSFEKGLVNTGSVVTKNNLDRFIYAKNMGIYLGGTNFTGSFQQILKLWEKASPYFNIIIEGMLRARMTNYFGTELSLEEDLYELFKNDYAFEVDFFPLPQLKIVLSVDDREKAKSILEKMFEGVYAKSEKYKTEKKDTELTEGIFVTELLVNDAKVEKQETDFAGTIIYSVEVENMPITFAYALKDDKVFMGTSRGAVQENLELLDAPEKSLAKNKNYIQAKKNMFLEGEEKSFFDFKKISQFLTILGIDLPQVNLLQTFDYAFFSAKWFDDGMANEAIFLQEK